MSVTSRLQRSLLNQAFAAACLRACNTTPRSVLMHRRCAALPTSKRYDAHGAQALDVNFVDASDFFAALFGSDRFEHLVRAALRWGGLPGHELRMSWACLLCSLRREWSAEGGELCCLALHAGGRAHAGCSSPPRLQPGAAQARAGQFGGWSSSASSAAAVAAAAAVSPAPATHGQPHPCLPPLQPPARLHLSTRARSGWRSCWPRCCGGTWRATARASRRVHSLSTGLPVLLWCPAGWRLACLQARASLFVGAPTRRPASAHAPTWPACLFTN